MALLSSLEDFLLFDDDDLRLGDCGLLLADVDLRLGEGDLLPRTPSLEHCKFFKKGVCWKPTWS